MNGNNIKYKYKKYMDNKFKSFIKQIIKEEISLTSYTKDTDANIFLNKVKEENPDKFPRFLNIVRNKGLDVAKEKYIPFDKGISLDNNLNLKLLNNFISFLPKDIVNQIKYLKNKYPNKNPKNITYLYLGYYVNLYGKKHNLNDANKIRYIFDSGKYDKEIQKLLARKFHYIFF